MLQTWVFGGNDAALGLGLNHLPYTAFLDERGKRRLGVAIGACVLDLHAARRVLPGELSELLSQPTLNDLLAAGPDMWQALRAALQAGLGQANRDRTGWEQALRPRRDLTLMLPVHTRSFTDFYAARDHARRVGELFRPDKPLLDNYDWLPIGYGGRASSLVRSGQPVRRPRGQRRGPDGPVFAESERLDFELELAFFIGQGNRQGEPIPIGAAAGQVFGVSLLNDWSARDLQAWEYQPLGPFLGKSFATSLSPLVTPIAALAPFRVPAVPHPAGLLRYLDDAHDRAAGALQVAVAAELTTERSRAAGLAPFSLSAGDTRVLFWTPAQMIAHHTSNGCNLEPGDLLASGTISGTERACAGCLLELTADGRNPLSLPNGETRAFLQDGDEITLTGFADAAGELPIRLGECRGRVVLSI